MGTKYQDSTPKRAIWTVGSHNKPHAWNTWGYDNVLVAFKVEGNITGGNITFEGYLGFNPPEEAEWGDWYTLSGRDVLTYKTDMIIPKAGKAAFIVKIIGFSQFRVREATPLEGEGSVQVAMACHAGV